MLIHKWYLGIGVSDKVGVKCFVIILMRALRGPFWLVCTTKVYSGTGADFVMESISVPRDEWVSPTVNVHQKKAFCDLHHNAWGCVSGNIVRRKRVCMFFSALLILAGIYMIFGAAIVRRLRKPTCRVCLFRQACLNRAFEYSDPARKPCWSCGEPAPCADSTSHRDV
jgi:hypothetical protein